MNDQTELEVIQPNSLQVITPSSLEAITRGEIDIQVATAHKFPRSMVNFKRRALEMATLDEETAASCLYSRPVGGGKFAEGMSIRMAEIVGASYGNLRVGAMIISQSERQVVCRGFAHDLESNFASTSEVVEATIKKDGKPYDERMRVVIAKACLAKARRDATFQVVPKALCKPVEAEARRVAIGDATTIAKRRGAVIAWIERLGIDKARVWKALNIAGEDDIGIDQLTTLTGLKTAIKDGEVSVDEAFPNVGAVAAQPVAKPPASAKKPEPDAQTPAPVVPKATPAEGIANLCKASGVQESALLAYLRDQGAILDGMNTLAGVPESVLENVKSMWPTVLDGLNATPGVPADDGESGAVETIPTEHGDLVKFIRSKAEALDLDEKQVVKFAIRRKWCNPKAASLSDMAMNALKNLVGAEGVAANKDAIAAE